MNLSRMRLGVNSRRSEIEIFADMLRMARSEVNKTTLLYQANLNYTLLQKYLAFLLERGLLEEHDSCYRTTRKGMEFLATLRRLQALLTDDSWQSPGVHPESGDRGSAPKVSHEGRALRSREPEDVHGDLWCRIIKILPSEEEAEKFLEKHGFSTGEKENIIRIVRK